MCHLYHMCHLCHAKICHICMQCKKFKKQSADCKIARLQSAEGCARARSRSPSRVQISDFRVQSAECRMQSAECRVQSADFRLQMRGGGQQSADCKSAECRGMCQSTEPLPQQSADCKSAECRGLCQSTEPLPQQSAESCEQIETSPLHYHITQLSGLG